MIYISPVKKRRKDKAILVRVTDYDRELLRNCAKRDGVGLSTWIRQALEGAAGKRVRERLEEIRQQAATEDKKIEPCALCGGRGWSLVNFQKVKCPRCGGEDGHLEAH